ncbi:MAG: PHP domain-containing protein, partial [Clostridia bacterium]|nr:PHP domain-containing protein [Clostridia bacterium]
MEKRTLYPDGEFKKGNLHTHSTRSDGVNTPKEVADQYRRSGYDFMAFTDHWVYGTNQELNREDFLVFPGTELDIELPGRKDHHIVAIGLPETNKIEDGHTFVEERKGNTLCTAERIIEYFGQRGNVTIYGHPYWSKVDSNEIKYLQGMIGMEIYNHGSEYYGNNGNSETYFDHFLFVRNRTFCFATDDSHDIRPESIGGYIAVKT